MIETETIHRRRCDLCRQEIDRTAGGKADPLGWFLPLQWGVEKTKLNIKLTIGECPPGGESQRGARPMDLAWARALIGQARAAGVAVWVKQLGGHPDPRPDLETFPEDLRVRELPAVARG